MSVGLDTSIVVRLLVGVPEDQCATAWQLVQSAADAGTPVLVADLVVAEAFFVLRHHYRVSVENALAALGALLIDERITGESATKLLANGSAANVGTDFIDALIHRYYADHRCGFVTFDKTAARLPAARLLKP